MHCTNPFCFQLRLPDNQRPSPHPRGCVFNFRKNKPSCYSARKKTHGKHCENYVKIQKSVFNHPSVHSCTIVITGDELHDPVQGLEWRGVTCRDTGCFLLGQGVQRCYWWLTMLNGRRRFIVKPIWRHNL